MDSLNRKSHDFSQMSASDYRALASSCTAWDPNPFAPHTSGSWHETVFPKVVDGVIALLGRFDAGIVSEQQLLRGKDNDKRPGPNGLPLCCETLSYWLYIQHHPGHELWKLLGQEYWSVDAYLSWRDQYGRTPSSLRFGRDRLTPSLRTFPKGGPSGLVSEHVVPKKSMKALLCRTRERNEIESLLRLNLCCVVTGEEDNRLERACHPNSFEPWQRYCGKGIITLHNPAWTDKQIEALLRNGLLSARSISPLPR